MVCLAAALMAFAPTAGAAGVSTSDNLGFPDTGGYTDQACTNGNGVNCNLYKDKRDVWLSGLPSTLGAGTYFFAVLDPGGQANPNDGAQNNLSDTFAQPYPLGSSNAGGGAIPSGDPWTNREFTVDASGNITGYGGTTHTFDTTSNKLQVFPYDDTTNNGGVYILAVCAVPAGAGSTTGAGTPGVRASDCKYDAFKVQTQAPTTCDPTTDPTCVLPPADDLFVTKDAAGKDTNTFTWGIKKSVDNTTITNASGSGTFNYNVTVTRDGGTITGVTVTGTIQAFNPNVDGSGLTVPVTGVDVTDQLSNGTNCPVTGGTGATLSSFETDFSYTCTLGSLPTGQLDNTAAINWPAQTLFNQTSLAANSATFTFTSISFAQTNVDDCVSVSDTIAGNLGSSICATTSFPYPSTVTGVPGTCVPLDNTATSTTNTTGTTGSDSQSVNYCEPADLTVTKTANTSYTRTYGWTIKKSADQSGKVVQSGGTLGVNYSVIASQTGITDSAIQATGTITVSNPNSFEAIPLTGVTDSVDNGATSCSITSGDPHGTVPASGSVSLGYVCTYADGSVPADGTNTATATWDGTGASTPTGTASGTAKVAFGAPAKTVNPTVTPTDAFNGGSAVNLCTLDTSDLCTLTASDDAGNPTTQTYKYLRTLTGTPGTCKTFNNTAGFVEISQTSDHSVQLCVAADLGVSKTATPAFTRTYNWSIKKSVDKSLVDQASGSATLNYTVVAKETGFTDSAWQVSGNITVSNPNDFESITATSVSDAVDNGGSCVVTGGTGVILAASSSAKVAYTCTYSSKPAYSLATNTATAAWDKTAAKTPDGTTSGKATFTLNDGTTTGNPTRVNQTVHVTDTFNGAATPTALGTLTATDDPTTFASATYSLAKTVTVAVDKCVDYPNTATLTETGQTSSVTTKVCGGVAGGLTMGFWQNKNGQAIITGGASTGTGKVCNSGTWLRWYAPFQDLSATATCAQVATYAYNLIKLANASGTSMNAMLKAQMLATALDVYFSDPALGTNKITAPFPIGGVKVDLTRICHMIDSSTGTGTCSGTFENVSSAFGNPPGSEMTVANMLLFENGVSNPGGSIWYAQLKTTQGLAKDAFDAINNGAAFAGP
jgi:hypothetical protein